MSGEGEDGSILEKLDQVVPAPLAQLDAFSKVPSSYKSQSDSRGFLTLFVAFVTFLLMLNDVGEYVFGWPDHEFSVDTVQGSFMNINVDMVVAMPCSFLSVDLRDAIGDRLFLSSTRSIRRDGTKFDLGQATALHSREHTKALSARQAVAQSRKSRGLLGGLFRWDTTPHMPSYKHEPDAKGCRISGMLEVKKVTANLHITTLGHGYASHQHVDHTLMNLSHVITEFSFGPYFPEIVQPLDNSFEVTTDHFVAYQYFLHVVPTTYIAPRSSPLHTNQYSVTHYTRVFGPHDGTPGIFFKFDLDPMSLTIHQRTPSFIQLLIRLVGVIGGVFTCMSWSIKAGSAAVAAVVGESEDEITPAAASTGASTLRGKFSGSSLRSRPKSIGKMIPQGGGWVMEGTPGSPYSGTPVSGSFPSSPYATPSPYINSPYTSQPSSPMPGSASFGPPPSAGPPRSGHIRTNSMAALSPASANLGSPRPRPVSINGALSVTSPLGTGGYAQNGPSLPGTPQYGMFPPTPNPTAGFSIPPPPKRDGKKDD
ncbi:unnamed protein product [Mycena citricolor]|uniref:DUF1692-domain-containing protein n=1 Tax=Mycena citricolor TaxID=2018698 RepID=A0AAD2H6Y3_9AGAR|nr:unnamed protein product [Mycena citricolor]